MLPPLKEASLTRRIARTYEEERAYRICIGDIINGRILTNHSMEELKIIRSLKDPKKKPKFKITKAMKILTLEFERKLFVGKSPEVETCNIAIAKCSRKREQLLNQLYMQLLE